jgi:hypothetical protein
MNEHSLSTHLCQLTTVGDKLGQSCGYLRDNAALCALHCNTNRSNMLSLKYDLYITFNSVSVSFSGSDPARLPNRQARASIEAAASPACAFCTPVVKRVNIASTCFLVPLKLSSNFECHTRTISASFGQTCTHHSHLPLQNCPSHCRSFCDCDKNCLCCRWLRFTFVGAS